jgi:hypothetical protein
MRYPILAILLVCAYFSEAQRADKVSYQKEISAFRQHYKNEFISEPRSPITAADTAFLDFYPPDPAWRVPAKVSLTPDSPVFDMMTYSGVTRKYRQYATVQFSIGTQALQLSLYQNLTLMEKDSSYRDYLFLPFKDGTNGEETYGGGRYLDFRKKDISGGVLILDFNKNYNPYCAFSDGYSCPIPPKENHLDIEVKAGEKNFKKEKMHGKH